MKYKRQLAILAQTLVVAITLIGCGASNETAPKSSTPKLIPAMIIPASPLQQTGITGAPAWFQPEFRVVDTSGNLVSDANVTCTVSSGAGTVSAAAVTNTLGVASCSQWVLGATAGDDTLTVAVPGVLPVIFVAKARAFDYFEIYDMRTVAGIEVPYYYPNGLTIDGGQLVLSPDGTFNSTEVWNGIPRSSAGRFTRLADSLNFDISPSAAPVLPVTAPAGFVVPHFAVGKLAGDSLSMDFGEEFDIEVFTKRK